MDRDEIMAFENPTLPERMEGWLQAPPRSPPLRRGALARQLGGRLRKAAPVQPAGVAAEARLETLQRDAGVLAHDLNNLLNVILAANEAIAQTQPAAAGCAELARMSQEAAESAAALLQRFASLDSLEHALPIDGGGAIQSVAHVARLSIPPSVMVEAQAAEEPLPCAVDSAGLESALLNLCVNAGHAMPDGGRLRLSAERIEVDGEAAAALGLAPGAYAALTVEDTGGGMSPEVLARATERGFSTRRGQGGKGLGLASVSDFARRAGGRLRLESEAGRGVTATLYLPLT